MGRGYSIRCTNSKCKYSTTLSEGYGFHFFDVYNEALQNAKNGSVSEVHQLFFDKHPEGAINAEEHIYQCKECGHLFSEMSMNMYLPKTEKIDFNLDHVVPDQLSHYYKLSKRYQHLCPNCGGKAKIVKDCVTLVSEKCPCCGSELYVTPLLWD